MDNYQNTRGEYIFQIPTTANGYKNRLNTKYYKEIANKNNNDYGIGNKQQYISKNMIDRMDMFSRFDDNQDRKMEKEYFDKKVRFRLKTNENEFDYKPEKKKFNFYQICQFDMDDKHLIRKLVYDQNLNLIRKKEVKIKKEKLKKFIKETNDNRYILYPTYNFDGITLPVESDILLASSQILNNDISCMQD